MFDTVIKVLVIIAIVEGITALGLIMYKLFFE